MSRKVDPPRRDQTARVVTTPRNGVDWIDRELVAAIGKCHGIRDGYDLYAALDMAVTWYLMETSKQEDTPTRDQRRQVFRQIDEHAAALEAIVGNLPFGLYEEITRHAPNGGWKSHLLDELRTIQAAVAPLHAEADKPAKRESSRARDNFLRNLIRIYEEGTERRAKVYWSGEDEAHQGAVLWFANECLALVIPVNEIGTNPKPPSSFGALAQALQKLLRNR